MTPTSYDAFAQSHFCNLFQTVSASSPYFYYMRIVVRTTLLDIRHNERLALVSFTEQRG